MSRNTKRGILIALFIMLSLGTVYAQRTMSVTIKEAEVKSTASFFGEVIATLSYGDSVRVRKEQGSWVQIDLPDSRGTGWVHVSALERKRIVFGASTESMSTEATSSEIALAGKGFNKEVEAKYIEETNLDFSRIDEMEGYTIPGDTLKDFVRKGGLNEVEGGGK